MFGRGVLQEHEGVNKTAEWLTLGLARSATVSLRFGGERGLVLKRVTPEQRPSVLRGVAQEQRFYWSLRVAKNGTFYLGLRRTEQLINEGKDQERYGHVEQPAYPGGDDW